MTKHIRINLPHDLHRGPKTRQSTRTPLTRDTTAAQICYYEQTGILVEDEDGDYRPCTATHCMAGWFWDDIKVYSFEGQAPADTGWAIFIWVPDAEENRWVPLERGCGNTWYFSAEGAPAGGTSEWDVTVNGVAEVVEFPCPCSRLQTIAALETHSEIAVGDVSVLGGDLPTSSQKVTFKNQPTDISLLLNSLTRSWTAPPGYLWDPC